MTADNSDWRLQGQEKFLKGLRIKKMRYHAYRAEWDHDHCEFCSAKFSETLPNCLREGYVSADNYHWICEPCFNDFRVQFKFVVEEAPV